ncbi:UNVERIFIED_CONTAM: hypothetical protein FKN15_024574 [Acipenser sinensis]
MAAGAILLLLLSVVIHQSPAASPVQTTPSLNFDHNLLSPSELRNSSPRNSDSANLNSGQQPGPPTFPIPGWNEGPVEEMFPELRLVESSIDPSVTMDNSIDASGDGKGAATEPGEEQLTDPAIEPGEEQLADPAIEPGEEQLADPAIEPGEEQLADPAIEPGEEQLADPAIEPGEEQLTDPAIEPGEEQLADPAIEPGEEQLADPAIEPGEEQLADPAIEPGEEQLADPAIEPGEEQLADPAIEPGEEQLADPAIEPGEEQLADPAIEPGEEQLADPAIEPGEEQLADPAIEPGEEQLADPAIEPGEEQLADPAIEPGEEQLADPAIEPGEEQLADPAIEPGEEQLADPAIEPGEEQLADPAIEPGEEQLADPAIEPGEEQLADPAIEPGEEQLADPAIEPGEEQLADPAIEPGEEQLADPAIEPGEEQLADPAIEPGEEQLADPAIEPGEEQLADPAIEPGEEQLADPAIEPGEEQLADPAIEPGEEQLADPAMAAPEPTEKGTLLPPVDKTTAATAAGSPLLTEVDSRTASTAPSPNKDGFTQLLESPISSKETEMDADSGKFREDWESTRETGNNTVDPKGTTATTLSPDSPSAKLESLNPLEAPQYLKPVTMMVPPSSPTPPTLTTAFKMNPGATSAGTTPQGWPGAGLAFESDTDTPKTAVTPQTGTLPTPSETEALLLVPHTPKQELVTFPDSGRYLSSYQTTQSLLLLRNPQGGDVTRPADEVTMANTNYNDADHFLSPRTDGETVGTPAPDANQTPQNTVQTKPANPQGLSTTSSPSSVYPVTTATVRYAEGNTPTYRATLIVQAQATTLSLLLTARTEMTSTLSPATTSTAVLKPTKQTRAAHKVTPTSQPPLTPLSTAKRADKGVTKTQGTTSDDNVTSSAPMGVVPVGGAERTTANHQWRTAGVWQLADPAIEPGEEQLADPAIEPGEEQLADPAIEPGEEQLADPAIEPGEEQLADPAIEPGEEQLADPAIEPGEEQLADPAIEPGEEQLADPAIEPGEEQLADPAIEPGEEQLADPAIEPGEEQLADPAIEPGEEQLADPAIEPGEEQLADPAIEPGEEQLADPAIEPGEEQLADPAIEPGEEQLADPAIEPGEEQLADPAIEPGEEQLADPAIEPGEEQLADPAIEPGEEQLADPAIEPGEEQLADPAIEPGEEQLADPAIEPGEEQLADPAIEPGEEQLADPAIEPGEEQLADPAIEPGEEQLADPAIEPGEEQLADPAIEPGEEQLADPAIEPGEEQLADPAIEPGEEQLADPAIEPGEEQLADPAIEPGEEQLADPAIEPGEEQLADPAIEPGEEQLADPAIEPGEEQLADPAIEPGEEQLADPAIEPGEEQLADPAIEPGEEQLADPAIEPGEEQLADPAIEPGEEQLADPAIEPGEEQLADPAIEPGEEQLADPAIEPGEEQLADPAIEPGEEQLADPAIEPGEEQLADPAIEPGEEQLADPAIEPGEEQLADPAIEPGEEQLADPAMAAPEPTEKGTLLPPVDKTTAATAAGSPLLTEVDSRTASTAPSPNKDGFTQLLESPISSKETEMDADSGKFREDWESTRETGNNTVDPKGTTATTLSPDSPSAKLESLNPLEAPQYLKPVTMMVPPSSPTPPTLTTAFKMNPGATSAGTTPQGWPGAGLAFESDTDTPKTAVTPQTGTLPTPSETEALLLVPHTPKQELVTFPDSGRYLSSYQTTQSLLLLRNPQGGDVTRPADEVTMANTNYNDADHFLSPRTDGETVGTPAPDANQTPQNTVQTKPANPQGLSTTSSSSSVYPVTTATVRYAEGNTPTYRATLIVQAQATTPSLLLTARTEMTSTLSPSTTSTAVLKPTKQTRAAHKVTPTSQPPLTPISTAKRADKGVTKTQGTTSDDNVTSSAPMGVVPVGGAELTTANHQWRTVSLPQPRGRGGQQPDHEKRDGVFGRASGSSFVWRSSKAYADNESVLEYSILIFRSVLPITSITTAQLFHDQRPGASAFWTPRCIGAALAADPNKRLTPTPPQKGGRRFIPKDPPLVNEAVPPLGRPAGSSPGPAVVTPSPPAPQPCPGGLGACSLLPLPNRTSSLRWMDLRRTLSFAWEMHVFGTAALFLLLALGGLINLIGTPILEPSARACLGLANALLVLAGVVRGGYFLTDPYGTKDLLPRPAVIGLYNLGFPLLLSAFGVLCLLGYRTAGLQVLPDGLQRLPLAGVVALLHSTLLLAVDLLFLALNPSVHVVLQVLSVSWGAFLTAGFLYTYPRLRRQAASPSLEEGGFGTVDGCNNAMAVASGLSSRSKLVLLLWRVLAICAVLGLLCCGLQVYAVLWLYGILGDWRHFTWAWWLVQFWYRLLELAWGFSMLVVASWIFWRRGGGGEAGGCTDGHTCWVKIVQSFCGRRQQKLDSNGGSSNGIGSNAEFPNNWASQERNGADISKSLIRNRPETLPLRALKESNERQARLALQGGSTSSLLFLRHGLGSRGKLHNLSLLRRSHSTVCLEKESILSLADFDLRPPSPIDLSRSIDEALFREHLVKDSLFSSFIPHRWLNAADSRTSLAGELSSTRTGCEPLLLSSVAASSPAGFRYRRSSDPNFLYSLAKGSSWAEPSGETEREECEKEEEKERETAFQGKHSSTPSSSNLTTAVTASLATGSKTPRHLPRTPPISTGSPLTPPVSIRLHRTPSNNTSLDSLSGTSLSLQTGQGITPTDDLREPFLGVRVQGSELDDSEREARRSFLEISRQIDSLSICSDTIDL